MKHLLLYFTLPSLLLLACEETVPKSEHVKLEKELAMWKDMWADQVLIIDSLSTPSPPPPVKEVKKKQPGKAATLDYLTLSRLGESIDRVLTKKGYGKNSTGKQRQSAFRQGFANAGYSWSATVHRYAERGFATGEIMSIGFLVVPYMSCKEEGTVESTFTAQELQDIKELERMMSSK